MKNLATIDENSPEAKKLNEAMEKVMGDDSSTNKKMDACKENAQIVAFNLGLLGVIMQAAPADDAEAK